jgi:hypothetical protein
MWMNVVSRQTEYDDLAVSAPASETPAEAEGTNPPATLEKETDRGEDGGTTLEWALLFCVLAGSSYFILKLLLRTLLAHYSMITTINSLPFP